MALVVIALSYVKNIKNTGSGKLPGIHHDVSRIVSIGQEKKLDVSIYTDDPGTATLYGVDYRPINRSLVEEILLKVLKEYSNLMLYFTGHGHKGSLEFSNGEVVKVKDLYKLISDNSTREHNILIMSDCCNGSSWGLPFTMKDAKWKFRGIKYMFSSSHIISISSSMVGEASDATNAGSIFTSSYYNLWKTGGYSSYGELAEKLGVRIFSTLVFAHLFPWLEK